MIKTLNYQFLLFLVFLPNVLIGITRAVGGDVGEHPGKAVGDTARLGEVHEAVVAAIAGRGSRNVAFVAGDEAKCFEQQRHDVGRLVVARNDEIIAGEAPHRSPVDNALAPLGVVAQVGGREVLHGVEGGGVAGGLAIGRGQTHIESCDHIARGGDVSARHVNPRIEREVVDFEAVDLFHRGSEAENYGFEYAECLTRGALPKFVVLRGVVGFAGSVADHPYAEEGSRGEVANLSNSRRLHVDSLDLGIHGFDADYVVGFAHENVARRYEPFMDMGGVEAGERENALVGGEEKGAVGRLALFSAGAAPDVVVGYLPPDDYVANLGVGACATRHTGVDHQVGGEIIDKVKGRDGGVDFADARFHDHDRVIAEVAEMICVGVDYGFARFGKEREQKLQLLVHRHDNCDIHYGVVELIGLVVD